MPNLHIFDAKTKSKQLFTPIKPNQIGLYVCGITVYDYCHIGHARTMIAFDYMVRFLRSQGWQVKYIRNITDIDDKIIQRAHDNRESIHCLTERFIKTMHQDLDVLGCLRPDVEPKATDYIQDMQNLTQTLLDKGYAYHSTSRDIYFSIEKYALYGKLSGRKLEDMQAGTRVELSGEKQHPFDFVLWKHAKLNEPSWSSPWGNGRPGWHIECSAMSMYHLGNHFDIHGGGGDLMFPHHENEIAQSEAATGETYVNYWIHTGFINVDGEKMSKSLDNFLTIRDALKYYHPETIRFFVLSSHYRSPINFSTQIIQHAERSLLRFYQAFQQVQPYLIDLSEDQIRAYPLHHDHFMQKFNDVMNDDFNTPEALAICFELLKQLNNALRQRCKEDIIDYYSTLLCIGKVLNILNKDAEEILQQAHAPLQNHPTEQEIQQAILARQSARDKQQYALADQIRQQLLKQGVVLEDRSDQTHWKYKNMLCSN